MKKTGIILITLCLVITLLYSSFGKSTELSDYDSVSGIAIDKDGETWLVLCELTVPSKDEPYGSKNEYVKGEGLTLSDAFKSVSEACKREVSTDSVRVFIISDSLMHNSALTDYFLYENVNMRAVAVYCDGFAYEHLRADDKAQNESILISEKIKRFCFENKIPVPKVTALLKNNSAVMLSKNGSLNLLSY